MPPPSISNTVDLIRPEKEKRRFVRINNFSWPVKQLCRLSYELIRLFSSQQEELSIPLLLISDISECSHPLKVCWLFRFVLACRAGVFGANECCAKFSVASILDYEEEEDWKRVEDTSNGVGIRTKSGRGRGRRRKNTSLFTIQQWSHNCISIRTNQTNRQPVYGVLQ